MGVLGRYPCCSRLPGPRPRRRAGCCLDSASLHLHHHVGLFPPFFSPPSEPGAARALPHTSMGSREPAAPPQGPPGEEEVEARAGGQGEACKPLRRKRATGQSVHGVTLWAPEALEAQAPCQQMGPLLPHPSPRGPWWTQSWSPSCDSEGKNQQSMISRLPVLLCWGSTPAHLQAGADTGGDGRAPAARLLCVLLKPLCTPQERAWSPEIMNLSNSV